MVPNEVYDALRFLLNLLMLSDKRFWVRQRCDELVAALVEREKHPCSPLPQEPARGVFSDIGRQATFDDVPMVFVCDITFKDTGEVIRDVVPAEARKQYAGRDFKETYSYRYKGKYTPYNAGLADSIASKDAAAFPYTSSDVIVSEGYSE